MQDAVELELKGKPTITVTHHTFERAARNHAAAFGLPDLPLLVEPAPQGGNLTREARAIAEKNLEHILASLVERAAAGALR